MSDKTTAAIAARERRTRGEPEPKAKPKVTKPEARTVEIPKETDGAQGQS